LRLLGIGRRVIYSIPILASNDLDFRARNGLVRLHLELSIFDDKGPDVVAETIRLQAALHKDLVRIVSRSSPR
jgi:hypothetical protein